MSKGSVIMLDAVGTKGVCSRREPKDYVSDWKEIVTTFLDEFAEASKLQHQIGKRLENLQFLSQAFSDTIVVTVEEREKAPLLGIIGNHLIPPFLSALERGVFLRGAISCGEYYHKGNILIGPAVDEAGDWFERGDWIGVMLTPSSMLHIRSHPPDQLAETVYRTYEVPLNREPGRFKTQVLNWNEDLRVGDVLKGKDLLTYFASKVLEAQGGEPILASFTSKFANTMTFLEQSVQSR